uniref:Uncharacterized protein n=1 Tax=Ceratitis capitata TaxID=7213 RepID=W8C4T2_CERCA
MNHHYFKIYTIILIHMYVCTKNLHSIIKHTKYESKSCFGKWKSNKKATTTCNEMKLLAPTGRFGRTSFAKRLSLSFGKVRAGDDDHSEVMVRQCTSVRHRKA